jgi:hypothetical protein
MLERTSILASILLLAIWIPSLTSVSIARQDELADQESAAASGVLKLKENTQTKDRCSSGGSEHWIEETVSAVRVSV